MPQLLRRAAIGLLEGGVESYHLGLLALGVPSRVELRAPGAGTAPVIGLLGHAAEMAMSACLVQALGPKAVTLPAGDCYKSGDAILDDFRELVGSATPNSRFLVQDVPDPAAHRERLVDLTGPFRVLVRSRADGLHRAAGPTRDVAATTAQDVHAFIEALGESSRIRPYIQSLPAPPRVARERVLILEDLLRSLRQTPSLEGKAELLAAAYLVLPDVPAEEPDWLQTLSRVVAVPTRQDVAFLLRVLERAIPATLVHVGAGEVGLPVAFAPSDPNALPIAPRYLGRELTQMPDQWYADFGTANARLAHGTFDPPPADYVVELFVLGLEAVGVVRAGQKLPSEQSWPFIASSLNLPGTPGPYWFLVRRTDDLAALRDRLEQAADIGGAYLRRRLAELLSGLQAMAGEGQPRWIDELTAAGQEAEDRREGLPAAIERNADTERAAPLELAEALTRVAESGEGLGDVLLSIVEDQEDLDEGARRYWARLLCESATFSDDLPALLAVLRAPEFESVRSSARKALRLVDFLDFGPGVVRK